jgi:hypothetical protein
MKPVDSCTILAMVEVIFVDFAKGVAAAILKERITLAFRAVVEQEINTTDVNRLVSQPFRTALAHLENAALEPEGTPRHRQFLEYALLEFTKAADLDAPLPAARAAFYAGFCHHLCQEPRHEQHWYERSLSMTRKMEADLTKKLKSKLWRLAVYVAPVEELARAYQVNLLRQLTTVLQHREAIEGALAKALKP